MENTELDIKKITLYNGEREYLGLPIKAFACNKGGAMYKDEIINTWGGNSNFKACNAPLEKISINSLAEAFRMMIKWSSDEERNDSKWPYLYGYIADYDSKTLYYDSPEVITVMNERFDSEEAKDHTRFIDDFTKVVLVPDWSASIANCTVSNKGEVEGIW